MFRRDFLNWRPDAEDFGNDGLVTADNVIHETEGYKPAHLQSAGGFSTTGGLAASVATVLAVQAKPIGNQNDYLVAWVANMTTPTLHVGINGTTGTTSATGHPLAFATAFVSSTATPVNIAVFDVTEYAGKIVWTVEAEMGTSTPSTTLSVAYTAYMDY